MVFFVLKTIRKGHCWGGPGISFIFYSFRGVQTLMDEDDQEECMWEILDLGTSCFLMLAGREPDNTYANLDLKSR